METADKIMCRCIDPSFIRPDPDPNKHWYILEVDSDFYDEGLDHFRLNAWENWYKENGNLYRCEERSCTYLKSGLFFATPLRFRYCKGRTIPRKDNRKLIWVRTDNVGELITKCEPGFMIELAEGRLVEITDKVIRVYDRIEEKRDTKPLYEIAIAGMRGIKRVIFSPPYTILLMKDGSKVKVKTQGKDKFNPEVGLCMAIAKAACGNNPTYSKLQRIIADYAEVYKEGEKAKKAGVQNFDFQRQYEW